MSIRRVTVFAELNISQRLETALCPRNNKSNVSRQSLFVRNTLRCIHRRLKAKAKAGEHTRIERSSSSSKINKLFLPRELALPKVRMIEMTFPK